MITIPVDSRFINAAVYLGVDVFVFAVLVHGIISAQSGLTRRTLLRGERVSLREFPFSPLAGGVISDGRHFSVILVALHLLLLGVLFLLALGINGRTDYAKRLTKREYISKLDPRTAPEVSVFDDRVYPQIMASCNDFENESLTYYAVAFDQAKSPSIPISARHLFRSLNGNIGTAVNSTSVVCQQYKGAPAILNVPRCGINSDSCCNLDLSPEVSLDLEPGQGGPRVWQRNEVRKNESSVVFTRNVTPVSFGSSGTKYDRLICLQFMSEFKTASSAGRARTNCMLGTWGTGEAGFIFRLGHVTFPDSQEERVLDVKQGSSVQFMAFSVETEIEWDAEAEIILVNGLHSIGGNMVPARLFLDTLVSRSSESVRVTIDQDIFELHEINVTDLHTAAAIGYAVLLGLAVTVLVSKLVVRWKNSFREGEDPWVPDITTYNGLLTLLNGYERSRGGRREERARVEFGITSIGSMYSLGPLEEGIRARRLPRETVLRWHRCNEDVEEAAKDDETLETRSVDSE